MLHMVGAKYHKMIMKNLTCTNQLLCFEKDNVGEHNINPKGFGHIFQIIRTIKIQIILP